MPPHPTVQDLLLNIAIAARTFLEPRWRGWHTAGGYAQPAIASRNTCGRTSLFLVHAIRHEGFVAEWQTGVPRPSEEGPEWGPFGFRVGARWESHSWVQSLDWIIDITADQFGSDPVIVTPASDERYRIGDRDPASLVHVANRWRTVEQLWPQWLDFRNRSIAP